MNRYAWLLPVLFALATGCTAEPEPPPELTEDVQQQIMLEDAQIEMEESANQ